MNLGSLIAKKTFVCLCERLIDWAAVCFSKCCPRLTSTHSWSPAQKEQECPSRSLPAVNRWKLRPSPELKSTGSEPEHRKRCLSGTCPERCLGNRAGRRSKRLIRLDKDGAPERMKLGNPMSLRDLGNFSLWIGSHTMAAIEKRQ